MPNKCKNQTLCEHCKKPIKIGEWIDTLAIDNHNMGHTHKIVFTHDYCTCDYLKNQYVVK